MSFFRRILRGESGKAPDWASFFSASDYNRFTEIVHDYFRARGDEIDIVDGGFDYSFDGEMNVQLGLHNLSQVCHASDRSDWREIIENHFNTFEHSERERLELEANIGDFNKVRDMIVVRLYPVGFLEFKKDDDGHNWMAREDIPGIISVLAFDLPSCVRSVTREETAAWNRSDDELFRIGLQNTRALQEAVQIDRLDLENANYLHVIGGESFMTATHALLLHDKPDLLGTHGAWVAVPHRHMVVVHPIEDLSSMMVLHQMTGLAAGMYEEGPGSISPCVYWYSDHKEWYMVPVEITEEGLRVSPPEEVVEMLNQLSEPSPLDRG